MHFIASKEDVHCFDQQVKLSGWQWFKRQDERTQASPEEMVQLVNT
jgi:hypothetical protein